MSKDKRTIEEVKTEAVHLRMTRTPPPEYHCRCRYCVEGFRGVLIRKDGTPYSRLDRNRYYAPEERVKPKSKGGGGHIAKTPLHATRWAIQSFTRAGDWVLDPTMGAGTTAVEALNHGRNVAGVEIQTIDIIEKNVAKNNPREMKYHVVHGDARDLREHMPTGVSFSLVVNNPPYSGDQLGWTDASLGKDPRDPITGHSLKMYRMTYDESLPNLAFLKEGDEYWRTMTDIYTAACDRLLPGGHFVVGVKDQMRSKKSDELHRRFAEVLEAIPKMSFEGVVILPHHPSTLFMNTYKKFYPDAGPLPRHQSIVVFRKEG